MLLFTILSLLGSSHAFLPSSRLRPTSIAALTETGRRPSTHFTDAPRPSARLAPLSAKLWDRLQIEEDPEPFWYLINCVAGSEMDLLRQCRAVCEDMPDAVKFVVPTEKKTRSHGAKKIVTETKVKYQGYVFAKLRLCPQVYEAIQGLDLCRSWMGTVNHKGHKKLPPAPIALNELEVQNFGLEKEESEESEESNTGDIIVDVEDEDAEDKIDKNAMKAYLGLKVEDMVKVTAKGKFFNEDGIVRRLKDGKIFVRFYTYGTMFEEWLDPSDVRKLSNIEILKGLSGPTRPVTQRDFDGPSRGYDDNRSGDMRRNLMSDFRGSGPRNRRQDRNERRFRQDGFRNDDERGRNDRNWNWYQDQQQDSRRRNDYDDRSYGYQTGSNNQRRDRGGDWAIGNVDSQWGRGPSQNSRERQPRKRTRRDNELADAALRGDGDWSSFVTPAGGANTEDPSGGQDDDDFFASLMSDLSSDLGNGGTASSKSSNRKSAPPDDENDFFDSLMSNVSKDKPTNQRKKRQNQWGSAPKENNDDDFFAALEAELGSAVDDSLDIPDLDDDLFSKLEAELSSPKNENSKSKPAKKKSISKETDDFFAELEDELSPSFSDKKDSADDFFAGLEADLANDLSEKAEDSALLDDLFADPEEAKTPAKKETSAAKPSSSAAKKADPGDLQKQTVPALKEMLRERGLKVSGKKAELIERLRQES